MISRSARGCSKRALSKWHLDKCKSQADAQQAASTKSAPVGGCDMDTAIVFGTAEQTSPLGGTYDTLFRTKLLLRAHAIAGIEPMQDSEPPVMPDGHDSTMYRVCPWDVVFRVECRIERCMRDVPYDQAKSWLLRLFDQEQRYWSEREGQRVDDHRSGECPVSDSSGHLVATSCPEPGKDRPVTREVGQPPRARGGR